MTITEVFPKVGDNYWCFDDFWELEKHFWCRVALGLTYNYEGDQYTWEEVNIVIVMLNYHERYIFTK